MNDHDRDLILDLIHGRLGEDEAEAALSRVSGDPELSNAYREQAIVRDSLASAGAVAMSATERSNLRAALTEQLHLEVAAPVPVVKAAPRRSWWKPVAGLAAAAAAVTAIVVLPGSFSSDESANSETAALQESSEAPAATLGTDPSVASAEDGGTVDLFADDEPVIVIDLSSANPDEILGATKGRTLPGDIESRLQVAGYSSELTINGADLEKCINQIIAELPEDTDQAHLIGAGIENGNTVVHLGLSSAAEGVDAIVTINLSDCTYTTLTNGLDVNEG